MHELICKFFDKGVLACDNKAVLGYLLLLQVDLMDVSEIFAGT